MCEHLNSVGHISGKAGLMRQEISIYV